MKVRSLQLLACALAAVMLFGCVGKNYDLLLPNVQDNAAKIKTSQQTWSIYIPEAGTDVQAQVAFECPNKMKADVTYPITASAVCDGKKLAVCVPDYNTCVNLDLNAETEFISPRVFVKLFAPQSNFVDLTERFTFKKSAIEEDAGKKLVVFDLTPKNASSKIGMAKMWVEMDRPVLTKVEVYDKSNVCKGRTLLSKWVQEDGIWVPEDIKVEQGDGSQLVTVSVTDIRLNQDIPDATFIFTAPKNAVVLDEVPPLGGGMPDVLFFE